MATTITEARDKVKVRALIGSTVSEPSNTEIENFVRDAFRWLFAAVPVIRRGVVTIADGSADLPADSEVIFAGRGPKLLFASEWGQEGTTIQTLGASVSDGDEITIYYTYTPEILTATAEVDSDSIFGQDWLEPPALVMATLNAYQKSSNRSPSRGAEKNVQMMRMMQEERSQLVGALQQRVERFYQLMSQRQNERRESGDIPVVSRRKGLINESRIVNPLVEE